MGKKLVVTWRVARPGNAPVARKELMADAAAEVDVRAALAAIMFLLDGHVIKCSVFDGRTAQCETRAIAAERRFSRFVLERVARIERRVLRKNKCVAVNRICSRPRNHIDRSAGSSARFRREAILNDLKFLHDFRRQFGAARSCVLIVVVEPVDRNRIAAGAQAAERKAAGGERCASSHGRRRRGA